MLEDLSLLYSFGLMFCLKEFNFIEKLEEKNECNKEYFEFLNKRCKTKKLGVQNAKNINILIQNAIDDELQGNNNCFISSRKLLLNYKIPKPYVTYNYSWCEIMVNSYKKIYIFV
jgi:hypothetical protein